MNYTRAIPNHYGLQGLFELSAREPTLPTPPDVFGSAIVTTKQVPAIFSADDNITLQAFVAANGGDFNQLRDVLLQNQVGSVFDEEEMYPGRKFFIPIADQQFSIHPDA